MLGWFSKNPDVSKLILTGNKIILFTNNYKSVLLDCFDIQRVI